MKATFSADKNLLKTVLVVAAVLFAVCAIGLVKHIAQTSKYEKVTASVTGIDTKYDTKTSHNQNRNWYVNYSFSYNGKDYIARKLTVLPFLYKSGKTAQIRIDPANPETVANPLFPAVYVLVCIICAALVIAIARHLFVRKF